MLSIEELKEIWLKSAKDRPDLMKRAEEGIEQNRKGNCRLLVTDKEGNPLKNTEVSVNQISHDFKFGAHIFMLDEFKSEEELFVAVCNQEGKFYAFKKQPQKDKNDIFDI